jgi:hypothetical protein
MARSKVGQVFAEPDVKEVARRERFDWRFAGRS